MRVHGWWAAVLLMLYQAQLLGVGGEDLAVAPEKAIDISTAAAAASSGTAPIWLVLPLLLDVHPALLRVDVKRHVPAQVQGFCREHGMGVSRCAEVIRDTLDEVVNLQRFCRRRGANDALPGFMVAKNVVRGRKGPESASWMQDDPENIAAELCSFAQQQQGGDVDDAAAEECFEALDTALTLTFEWMLELTPCDTHVLGGAPLLSSKDPSPDLSDRLSTIETMIAALMEQTHLHKEEPKDECEGEVDPESQAELVERDESALAVKDTETSSVPRSENAEVEMEEFAVVEEDEDSGADVRPAHGELHDIGEEERPETTGHEDVQRNDDLIEESSAVDVDLEEGPMVSVSIEVEGAKRAELNALPTAVDIDTAVQTLESHAHEGFAEEEKTGGVRKVEEVGETPTQYVLAHESVHEDLDGMDEDEATEDTAAPQALADSVELISADESEASIGSTVQPAGETVASENQSYLSAYSVLNEEQLQHLSKDAQSKMWAFVVTLALLLSIAYLVVDLLLICVQRIFGLLVAPKQLGSILLESVLALLRGETKSKLVDSSSSLGELSGAHSPRNMNAQVHVLEPPSPEVSSVTGESQTFTALADTVTIDEGRRNTSYEASIQEQEALTEPMASSPEEAAENSNQPVLEVQEPVSELRVLAASVPLPQELPSEVDLPQVEALTSNETLPETDESASDPVEEENGDEDDNESEVAVELHEAIAASETSSEDEELGVQNHLEEHKDQTEEPSSPAFSTLVEDVAVSSDAGSETHGQENPHELEEPPELSSSNETSLELLPEAGQEEQNELPETKDHSEVDLIAETTAASMQASIPVPESSIEAPDIPVTTPTTTVTEPQVSLSPLRSAPHRPTPQPSFTCAAMALLVGNHASFFHKTASMSMVQGGLARQSLSPSGFWASLPSSGRELVDLMQQKGHREQLAARRIQRAWKAMRRRDLPTPERSSPSVVSPAVHPLDVLRGHIRASTPIFRLLQLQSDQKAQTPFVSMRIGGVMTFTGSAVSVGGGYRRLASNAPPPC